MAVAFAAFAPCWVVAAPWTVQALKGLPCPDALKQLNRGIEAGDVEALRVAGTFFDQGVCVEAAPTRAAQFYQRAADQGDHPSAQALAMLFATGRGVPHDYATAGALLREKPVGAAEALTVDDYTRGYAFALSSKTAAAMSGLTFRDFASEVRMSRLFVVFDPSDPVVTAKPVLPPLAGNSMMSPALRQSVKESVTRAMRAAAAVLAPPDRDKLLPHIYRIKLEADDEKAPRVSEFNLDAVP